MHLDPSIRRILLVTFASAAGCNAGYGDYVSDREVLECELRVACGDETLECEPEEYDNDPGSCNRYNRSNAKSCIEALEEYVVEVESDIMLCDERPWEDLVSCDNAVTRRNSGRCSVVTGRPLVHDGRAVLPQVTRGNVWAEQCLTLRTDSKAARAAAEYWLEIARAEHASVAAFSRASLELMSLGAPPHLLEGCHQAALEEIRHARLALDIARALGEPSWDLGPIPATPSREPTLRVLAVDALLEGCIGEGGAAGSAYLAAARARGPVAQGLHTIAADETRHAALAWATLRWALEADPSLSRALREAVAAAAAERRRRLDRQSVEPSPLAELGVMSAAEVLRVELDVIETIVEPVLAALLREHASPVLTV